MNFKNLALLTFLIPSALHAMDEDYQKPDLPPTLDELKMALTQLQDERILNNPHQLPTLEITMTLTDLDPKLAAQFPPKPARADRYCTAYPDKDGNYTIKMHTSSGCKIKYAAYLTSLRIDNHTDPLIRYRIGKILYDDSSIEPADTDLSLSIPYETPRTFEVAIIDGNSPQTDTTNSIMDLKNMAHKKHLLEILIQKTTHPDLPHEMHISEMIHAMAFEEYMKPTEEKE